MKDKRVDRRQGADERGRVAVKRVTASFRPLQLLTKGTRFLLSQGPAATVRRVLDWNRRRTLRVAIPMAPDPEEFQRQRATRFPRDIRVSVIVPLYNTPEAFLREMIQSVQGQSYENWELCLADGSDAEHAAVGEAALACAAADPRILYRKLARNGGISENTNACLDMATGNFIALFDHDDLLHPSALFEVVTAICERDADFVYTDEMTFQSPDVNRVLTVHFKPDFAVDNLRANNYICHLSVFSRELLDRAGRFRQAYDGSQDHDMILRLTARARNVVHIPKVLYFWRSHPQSVASDISAKEYAVRAGQNAVRDSLAAAGLDAEVDSAPAFPALYRIRYALRDRPLISLLILYDGQAALRRCVASVLERTAYDDYEILILARSAAEAMAALDSPSRDDPRVRVCDVGERGYGAAYNEGARQARGSHLVLLSGNAEVLTPDWLEALLMYVQREDVAAAGAMLYDPDDTVRHAGLMLARTGDCTVAYPFFQVPKGAVGYMGRLCYSQDVSAVSAACMMVRASTYREAGGLDEGFGPACGDVDLCLRLRRAGHLIVWTPYAELRLHEDKQSGGPRAHPQEIERFRARWADELAAGDPYFPPGLTRITSDFGIRF